VNRFPRCYVPGAMLAVAVLVLPAGVSIAAAQPARRADGPGQVAASFVHGQCHGGGSMSLEVDRSATGYTMSTTVLGVPKGSRWRVALAEQSSTNVHRSKEVDARQVARDGGWTLTRAVRPVPSPYFDVVAFGPHKVGVSGPRFCSVLVSPVPLAGVTFCRQSAELSMVAMPRAGMGTVVRWLIIGARPDTVWTVSLAGSTGSSGTGVSFRTTANRQGIAFGRVVFSDLANPRLTLSVAAAGGQRCSLGMHRVLAHPAPARSRAATRVTPVRTAATELTSLAAGARRLLTTG
jgi:hypothetical protein